MTKHVNKMKWKTVVKATYKLEMEQLYVKEEFNSLLISQLLLVYYKGIRSNSCLPEEPENQPSPDPPPHPSPSHAGSHSSGYLLMNNELTFVPNNAPQNTSWKVKVWKD